MEEVPFEDRVVPRAEMDWGRSAWWWIPLTRSVHPAIKLSSLVAGLLAVCLAQAGVRMAAWLFQPSWAGVERVFESETPVYLGSPLIGWCAGLIQAVRSIEFDWNGLAFFTFSALWLTAVFSLVGGVFARRAMVELGQQTIAPWGESLRIVLGRWVSLLWATGMHLVGLACFLLPVFVLGLLSRWGDIGGHVAGVLLLLSFPLVFAVGRLCMSMVFCYPLSVCAIAAERKADAFEGFSRSNAYLYQRPVVALLCVGLLLLIGLAGEQLVYWTLTFGWGLMGAVFAFAAGGVSDAAATYVAMGTSLQQALLGAYWFGFAWSAAAAIYLILRRSVDSTELYELDALESDDKKVLPKIPDTPPDASSAGASAAESPDGQPSDSAS